MNVLLLPVETDDASALDGVLDEAVRCFSDEPEILGPRDVRVPGPGLAKLMLGGDRSTFTVDVRARGLYALFTQHLPAELGAELVVASAALSPLSSREFAPDHVHDEAVTSVGITIPGDLNPDKVNAWIGELVPTQGPDIVRMKGVLSIAGHDRRFVFQGVHMLLDGRPDRPWGRERRENMLIFIGRNLDRGALTDGFLRCLVSAS
jgi:Cobalamin synthesis protein cobW C-terminal domain